MAMLTVFVTVYCLCLLSSIDGIPTDQQNCQQCVQRFQAFVKYAGDELFKDEEDLLQICQQVPEEYSAICHDLLTSYGSDISTEIDPDYITAVCKMLNQCETTSDDNDSSQLIFNAEIESEVDSGHHPIGLPCMLCVNFMRLAHSFLKDKSHQALFLRLLKGVCRFLPVFQAQCNSLVDSYGPIIVQFAANWLRPEVCMMFHICPSQLVSTRSTCRMCQLGAGIIRDTIGDPLIETRIMDVVDTLCEDSGIEKTMCDDLKSEIHTHLPDFIKALRQTINFSTVCQESGFCGKNGQSDFKLEGEEDFSEDVDWWSEEEDE